MCRGLLQSSQCHHIPLLQRVKKWNWLVLAAVAAADLAGHIFYKYRLRSYMDSKITAIMSHYMPLDNHINNEVRGDSQPLLCIADPDRFRNEKILENTKELKERLTKSIHEESNMFKIGGPQIDEVRFGTAGWKERYYKQKFAVKSAQESEAWRRNYLQIH